MFRIVDAATLVAAPGDAPGLLDEAWEADAIFQERADDGRDTSLCLFTWRDPNVATMPLMLQTENAPAHMGAQLAGFITEASGQDPVRMSGRFYDTETGRQARDMLLDGRKFGVSVDGISGEMQCIDEDPETGLCNHAMVLSLDIGGLTMEPFAAFARPQIRLQSEATMTPMMAAAPTKPPRAWFEMPEPNLGSDLLIKQTSGGYAVPLTITDDGQVFGHVADQKRCHIGIQGQCRTAPKSSCGYARFHLGAVPCDDGTVVAAGPLTCGTDHAGLRGLTLEQARDHYANSGLSWADVRIIDGQFGPWACGALRPDVTDDQRRALQALSLSGDWRPVQPSGIEMIAVLSVNTPGFPIEREALAASGLEIPTVNGASASFDGDELSALVAAGIVQRCPECAERARIETEAAAVASADMGMIARLQRIETKVGQLADALEPQAAAQLRARVHVA